MRYQRNYLLLFVLFISNTGFSQYVAEWKNVDSAYGPLPDGLHIYYTESKLDTTPFKAYYIIADLKDKKLDFTTDTTNRRRLTPFQFYEKNHQPYVVVNGTFFSFETNLNLNVVVKDGKAISYNRKSFRKKDDSVTVYPVYSSAIGITIKRKADIAWIKTDSISNTISAAQFPITATGAFFRKSVDGKPLPKGLPPITEDGFDPWKMETAIGGGPVLVQQRRVMIANEQERMFMGKAINDKHPRTAMGYTKYGQLIILAVEGRNPSASGASLTQLALIMKELGCEEALNLDGGGSSCLLVNGKETIKPSDKTGQRPVPAVFIIQKNQ